MPGMFGLKVGGLTLTPVMFGLKDAGRIRDTVGSISEGIGKESNAFTTNNHNNKRGTIMNGTTIAIVLVSLAVAGSTALAQAPAPRATKRQVKQEARIHEGVKSGELTKGETARLQAQQMKINRDKKRAKADGVVTPREKAKLKLEKNRASKNIYLKKHNMRK